MRSIRWEHIALYAVVYEAEASRLPSLPRSQWGIVRVVIIELFTDSEFVRSPQTHYMVLLNKR